jgi:predicted ATPase
MFINIVDRYGQFPRFAKSQLFLTWNDWDDYGYRTTFGVFYVDEYSKKHDLDAVKIAYFGQKPGLQKLQVGDAFEELPKEYFSLGNTFSYYENLNTLPQDIKEKIFIALHDIAKDEDIFSKAILEDVTQQSLLRSVTETEVSGQFRRIANGGSLLTPYDFVFETTPTKSTKKIRLTFKVEPESEPPTNIHVLIGRNGSGKTTMLKRMVSTLLNEDVDSVFGEFGIDKYFLEEIIKKRIFPTLINVTFSAFDADNEHIKDITIKNGIKYYYVGLKKESSENLQGNVIKTPSDLNFEFFTSLNNCKNNLIDLRWRTAIKILESDVNFKDEDIISLIDENNQISNDRERQQAFKERALHVFSKLSSGHKIVLLTITRLVELVEEKALIIIDEPETHLHPPLLSAFIRSLSDLLTHRNGVAIIATHSPVILQEVPKSCVWKIVRDGNIVRERRLRIESFGEDVGTLTHEVFNLEVTNSGFHTRLKEVVSKTRSYEDAVQYFQNNLGVEAKAILRSMFYQKSGNNDSNT